MQKSKYLIGIDEVGRGPLAGPVAVGVVRTPANFDWVSKLAGVTDSKKLTEQKQESIYKAAFELRKIGLIDFSVAMVSAEKIDQKGIQWAIRNALARSVRRVGAQESDFFKLDGGLYAPEKFLYQETIIKGDAKEQVIGLASIVAKVTRDRYMVRKADLPPFAPYDFAQHKGYGTKTHRVAIAQHGLSPEHRASYCRNIK